jgi:hypothetical protein
MTPQEKAQELIDKYVALTDGWAAGKNGWEHKKQCALIAVNEILDLGYVPSEKSSFNVYNFYSNVKIELNKL